MSKYINNRLNRRWRQRKCKHHYIKDGDKETCVKCKKERKR